MYDTSEFRKGLKIEFNGEPYIMVDFQHVKPGKGGAFVRTRLKNMITGNILEHTFRSGEKVGEPNLEQKEMHYLYHSGDEYYFMDKDSYEQIVLNAKALGEAVGYIKDETLVKVLFYNGEPIGVELDTFVLLKVIESPPGVRGDTVSNVTKEVTLETGLKVQVPLFIEEGDIIKIDTRTGEYVERVSK